MHLHDSGDGSVDRQKQTRPNSPGTSKQPSQHKFASRIMRPFWMEREPSLWHHSSGMRVVWQRIMVRISLGREKKVTGVDIVLRVGSIEDSVFIKHY